MGIDLSTAINSLISMLLFGYLTKKTLNTACAKNILFFTKIYPYRRDHFLDHLTAST